MGLKRGIGRWVGRHLNYYGKYIGHDLCGNWSNQVPIDIGLRPHNHTAVFSLLRIRDTMNLNAEYTSCLLSFKNR